MVPKTGTRLPKLQFPLSDSDFAELMGKALREELGGSRRATKTVMAWTGVSDHTARAWLNGRKSPSSLHLLSLASKSHAVMVLVLRLTGHDDMGVEFDLQALEAGLEDALAAVRASRSREPD